MNATKLSLTSALILLLVAENSYALVDKATFDRLKKSNPDVIKSYVSGLAEGMSWANAELQTTGANRHFCVPETIPLNVENYMFLIEDELSNRANLSETADMPVGLALFRALQRKFPCGK